MLSRTSTMACVVDDGWRLVLAVCRSITSRSSFGPVTKPRRIPASKRHDSISQRSALILKCKCEVARTHQS